MQRGELEFIGRNDDQVKIRGHRIELGEVEAVLREHAEVSEAVVVARDDVPGEKRLVGYVVGVETEAPSSRALREYLHRRMPEYMVPSAFVRLERLPLTANGKVDRQALPAPEGRPEGTEYAAPRTPMEEALAGIWARGAAPGPGGNPRHFFELGGHSLVATRVIARIRETLEVELPLRALFEAPTISGFGGANVNAQRRRARVCGCRRCGRSSARTACRCRLRRSGCGFWSSWSWWGQPTTCRWCCGWKGRWIMSALATRPRRSWSGGMRVCGRGLRCVAEMRCRSSTRRRETFQLWVEDLSRAAGGGTGAACARVAGGGERRERFDLERGPLFRAGVMRLGAGEHVLLLTMHHIVTGRVVDGDLDAGD